MEVSKAELVPLWNKYKRLARKAAKRFASPHYEEDDLVQECFIIFMAAVKEYSPDIGCGLTTYVGNRFKWGLYRLIYDNFGQRHIREVCALDTPMDTDDSGRDTMVDLVPDPTAEFEERTVDSAALSEVWEICRCELGEQQYNAVESFYKYGATDQEHAKNSGITAKEALQQRQKAINQLSRSRRLRQIYIDVIGQSLVRSGLGYFRQHGESSVEWAVLESERRIELMRERIAAGKQKVEKC